DAQPAKHHAGSGTAENGEERKILQIDDGERSCVNGSAQFAESEMSAERAEERQKSAASEQQAGSAGQTRGPAVFDGGNRIEATLLSFDGLSGLWRSFGGALRGRRNRNVNEHLRVV